jgi:molybdopterin synthase sulfur carrier subunit
MMIEVLFFAGLREALATDRLEVAAEPGLTAEALLAQLADRGGAWQQALAGDRPVMVAINEELVSATALLTDGDTVAFFPPVTGG